MTENTQKVFPSRLRLFSRLLNLRRGRILFRKDFPGGEAEFFRLAYDAGAVIRKDGSTVRAVTSGGFFLKEFRYRSARRYWLRNFHPSRAAVALRAADWLARHRIPTPGIRFAAVNVKSPGGRRSDCIVNELLPENTVFADRYGDWRQFAAEFMPILAMLHALGFYHGDLSLRNIYRAADDGFYRWGLIDLDGSRGGAVPLSTAKRIKEVAKAASSCCIAHPEEKPEQVLAVFTRIYRESSGIELPEKACCSVFTRYLTHARARMKKRAELK